MGETLVITDVAEADDERCRDDDDEEQIAGQARKPKTKMGLSLLAGAIRLLLELDELHGALAPMTSRSLPANGPEAPS